MFKSLIPTSLSIYRNLSKIQKNIYVTFLHIFVFPFFVSRYFSVLFFDFFSIFFSILLSKFKLYFFNFFKIFFLLNAFTKLLPQNVHFQNCSLKKIHFLKITPSENTFSKFLSEIMKNTFSKYIFKIVCLKNIFSKLLPQKLHFWNFPSKKKKLKLLPQKRHFQNCSSKKFFWKLLSERRHFQKTLTK